MSNKLFGFNDMLSVETINNEKWKLLKPLSFKSQNTGLTINVPSGFESDLASSPRFVWWFVAPWDIARSAVIHDYMYANQSLYTRKEADEIFLEAMKYSSPKISEFKRLFAYLGVRIFGRHYY